MKYKEILLNLLKSLPYFDKKAVLQLSEQFSLKSTTVDSYISRYLKYKDIFQLKNGLYIPTDFYYKNKVNTSYLFFLANIIRKPSYVSSWTALQHYNLATEAIHTITSVTPKVTRAYKTKIGAFSYQSVKEGMFSNFTLVKDKPASSAGGFEFFIATPAKALFDLLYFKKRQFRGVEFKDIDILINELRIDINEMDKTEQEKFYLMIKDYMNT